MWNFLGRIKINTFTVTKDIDYDEVKSFIENSPPDSVIYLGCDSQNVKKKTVFGLSIVVHISGSKGAKCFVKIANCKRIVSLRQRLMKEVEVSIAGAFEIIDSIGDRHFEIHLDINGNPDHKSNIVCKEAIGYVTGQGFDCKIKPDAFAASSVADHCIRM